MLVRSGQVLIGLFSVALLVSAAEIDTRLSTAAMNGDMAAVQALLEQASSCRKERHVRIHRYLPQAGRPQANTAVTAEHPVAFFGYCARISEVVKDHRYKDKVHGIRRQGAMSLGKAIRGSVRNAHQSAQRDPAQSSGK